MVTSRRTVAALDNAQRTREEALADAVRAAASAVVALLSTRQPDRSREEWVVLVEACQSLVNTMTAAQDVAVAEVARRESVWSEDGTVGEDVHAPGAVTLDAADLVAPALGTSHPQAQRRVEQAVRLASGRVPVAADRGEVAPVSGVSGLHAAMADGRLDEYRAGVVAYELEEAPGDVAEAVVAALAGHLDEDGSGLRRRVRRLLARISPDLLRQRAQRARASTGLRRWVAEPGVDAWFGTFPSEDAACAWAAIDRLAHDYVADGTCTSVEQARGRALTDLVTGNATVDVQVVVTVPADACSADALPAEARPAEAATTRPESPCADADAVPPTEDACLPRIHAGPSEVEVQAGVPARGEPVRCSMRGSPAVEPSAADVDEGATSSDRHSSRAEHRDDLVEVQGARPSEPLLVPRGWLMDHLVQAPRRAHRGRRRRRGDPPSAPCHPLTGARLDFDDVLASTAYRAGTDLAALVRARDGRCRFPGCAVAARFCDLDHARAWPTGPTAASNLVCLCRRHHRIKQSPGWAVRLDLDGTATWTDPLGRVRTTAPLNALEALVLQHEPTDPLGSGAARPPSTAVASTGAGSPLEPSPRGGTPRAWSALETRLELRLEHLPPHRRCTSSAALRDAGWGRRAPAPVHDPPPF